MIAKWLGHRPGNHKVPGSMSGCCCVSLGKKLTLIPATQLLNRDIVCDGTAEKQPLADAVFHKSLWLMLPSLI